MGEWQLGRKAQDVEGDWWELTMFDHRDTPEDGNHIVTRWNPTTAPLDDRGSDA